MPVPVVISPHNVHSPAQLKHVPSTSRPISPREDPSREDQSAQAWARLRCPGTVHLLAGHQALQTNGI